MSYLLYIMMENVSTSKTTAPWWVAVVKPIGSAPSMLADETDSKLKTLLMFVYVYFQTFITLMRFEPGIQCYKKKQGHDD